MFVAPMKNGGSPNSSGSKSIVADPTDGDAERQTTSSEGDRNPASSAVTRGSPDVVEGAAVKPLGDETGARHLAGLRVDQLDISVKTLIGT